VSGPGSENPMAPASGDADYITALVRTHDRPRYYASLFAPAERRQYLFALYAMNTEICRIPASVAEPGLGDIRLQWWQDAISLADREDGETPVMRALVSAMRDCRLPGDALVRLAEAHRSDLYGDPRASLQDLETDSALFQLASLVLGSDGPQTAKAAGHAGIAHGLANQICTIASLRRMGRQIAPADLLEIYDIEPKAMFANEPPAGFKALLDHLVDLATRHFQDARSAIHAIPAGCRPAFLPVALVPGLLKRAQRNRQDLWHHPAVMPDLAMLTRIGRAAVFGI